MRTAVALLALAATTISGVAFAQTNRLTDVEYLQVARCAGLAASQSLGAMDTASIDSLLKAQRMGRAGYIIDQAQGVRAETERAANRAKPERKATLLAERAGVCAHYLGQTQAASL